jgi:glyoxylase-like metal-dependent hydrolase (beta-lactamase superfamily II)
LIDPPSGRAIVPALEVVAIPNGTFAQNCYLVHPRGSSDAAIVDPGEESARILAEAARRGLRITAIWLTHAHIDHVLGVAAVRAATGAPISLHPSDRPFYDNAPTQGLMFGIQVAPLPAPDVELHHGDVLTLGDVALEVRHVPGHSPGHVVLVAPGLVLGGDVLFAGSIGRTDLPGGDLETLLDGIRRELLTLPDETVVYSGHGPPTTIGVERNTNPFLT